MVINKLFQENSYLHVNPFDQSINLLHNNYKFACSVGYNQTFSGHYMDKNLKITPSGNKTYNVEILDKSRIFKIKVKNNPTLDYCFSKFEKFYDDIIETDSEDEKKINQIVDENFDSLILQSLDVFSKYIG